MARLIGPDEASRLLYTNSPRQLASVAQNTAVVMYTDATLTTLADIVAVDGSALPGSSVLVDAYSRLPLFQYPNGVDTVYCSVGGGPSTPIYARTDDRLDSNAAAIGQSFAQRVPRARPNLTMVTTFQTGHGWAMAVSGGGTTNPNDTTDFLYGTQAVSGITPATGGAVTVQKPAAMAATDMTTKYLGVLIKMDRPDLATSITVRLGTGGFAAYETLSLANGGTSPSCSILPNQWAWVYTSYANLTSGVLGSPNRAAITDIHVRTDIGTANAVAFHVGAVAVFNRPPVFPNGVITLGFDDSYPSQYTMARPKMDQYGMPGVFYTIVEAVTLGGSITLPQLTDLQENHGGEVAGHAFTYAAHNAGYSTLSASALATELGSLRSWLNSNGFAGGDHFAYPLGDDGVAIDTAVGQQFVTARSTVGTPFGSLPPDQRLRMRCVLVGASTGVATTEGYIDKAFTYGLWLHIVIHNILTSGASGTTQILQTDFNTIVDYIATKGIPVRTVSEVYRALAANPGS